jgi:hypothetical protein
MDLLFLDLLYVMVSVVLHWLEEASFSRMDKKGYTSRIVLFLIAWDIHMAALAVALSHDASL